MDWPFFFNALSGLGGITAAITLLIGSKRFRKQMNVQTFVTYTERYERIINDLPLEIRLARFELSGDLVDLNPQVQAVFLRYFNMCSEEYYLQSNGYLDRRLWSVWEDEIKRTVASQVGRSAWTRIRSEFDSYPEFQSFVAAAQNDSDQRNRTAVTVTT